MIHVPSVGDDGAPQFSTGGFVFVEIGEHGLVRGLWQILAIPAIVQPEFSPPPTAVPVSAKSAD